MLYTINDVKKYMTSQHQLYAFMKRRVYCPKLIEIAVDVEYMKKKN